MTIVIADTSPLNYLILIDAIEVLPEMYGEVIISSAVLEELRHPEHPKLSSAGRNSCPRGSK